MVVDNKSHDGHKAAGLSWKVDGCNIWKKHIMYKKKEG